MTEQADPIKLEATAQGEQVLKVVERGRGKNKRRVPTTAERVAALQAGKLLPNPRSAKDVRPPGPTVVDRSSEQIAKILVDITEQAHADLQANPPPPLSVRRAPLELAVHHARNMVRKQKRDPRQAATIAAQLFELDSAVVLSALEAVTKKRAPKEVIDDDARDEFDDEGWDEDA